MGDDVCNREKKEERLSTSIRMPCVLLFLTALYLEQKNQSMSETVKKVRHQFEQTEPLASHGRPRETEKRVTSISVLMVRSCALYFLWLCFQSSRSRRRRENKRAAAGER